MLGFTQWIVAVTAVLRVWPGWGFGGRQARGVIRDWGYTARHGRFPRLDGEDVEAGLVDGAYAGARRSASRADQYTPRATLDHLCAKLTAAPVQRVHLHRGLIDHFTWVRAAGAVADRVAAVRPSRRLGAA